MHTKSFIFNQKNHSYQRFIQRSVYKGVHQTSNDSSWTSHRSIGKNVTR